jgi:hypothetical protein
MTEHILFLYRRWHDKRNKCVGREFQQTSILSKTGENEKQVFVQYQDLMKPNKSKN